MKRRRIRARPCLRRLLYGVSIVMEEIVDHNTQSSGDEPKFVPPQRFHQAPGGAASSTTENSLAETLRLEIQGQLDQRVRRGSMPDLEEPNAATVRAATEAKIVADKKAAAEEKAALKKAAADEAAEGLRRRQKEAAQKAAKAAADEKAAEEKRLKESGRR